MDILVIGSMNMDLVVKTERYPDNGETISGSDFKQIPGGKGANQACAAARLGADVAFIGACGQDDYGTALLLSMERSGVNTEHVFRLDTNTGIAAITVDNKGENRIIIVPGANGGLTPDLIDEKEEYIKEAKIVLLQMEVPLNTVLHTIKVAKKYDAIVILDPAPAQELPGSIYGDIDFLLPNEVELMGLLKNRFNYNLIDEMNQMEKEKLINILLEYGVSNIILTRGSEGVSLYSNNKQEDFSVEEVKVVDTTAAGDAFAGGLAFGLSQGKSINESIKYANVVAALSVTRFGAQSSLPDRKEVEEYIGY